jgi:D-arabinose 1-dehydrogenase-like Zn-dependent alcohol dehydrogenase
MASYTDLAAKGIQAPAPGAPMQVVEFQRHAPGPLDIVIKVTHCGVCHTDCHACFDPVSAHSKNTMQRKHSTGSLRLRAALL